MDISVRTGEATTKRVHDYDFHFDNGFLIPITLDLEAGDVIKFSEDDKYIFIRLVEKPNDLDPTKTLPAEDITIRTDQVVFWRHWLRDKVIPSVEQRVELEQLFKSCLDKGSGSVN